MSNLDSFSLQFARDFPDAFARAVARFDLSEMCSLLNSMPGEVAAGVVAHFSTQRITTLLATGQVRPDDWLEAGQFEDAVAILGLLPREKSLELVNSLENRVLRRRLLQFLSYPEHTVGSLVSDPFVRLRHDQTITEVLSELQSLQSLSRQPTLVVEQNGKYLGILKLWEIMARGIQNGFARDYAESVDHMRPEFPLARAIHAEQWRHHLVLPVVDHQQRVLGVISQNKIVECVDEMDTARPTFQGNLSMLGEQYVNFMGGLLGRLLDRRRLS